MVEERVDDVSLVDGVFNGAFGGDGEEDFVMGEGVIVSSSLLDRYTKSILGRMMVSLIFLEGLKEEAWVKAMKVEEKSIERIVNCTQILRENMENSRDSWGKSLK
ncbi:hypothetical protein Tco_0638194 [Tanacetum coccineum]